MHYAVQEVTAHVEANTVARLRETMLMQTPLFISRLHRVNRIGRLDWILMCIYPAGSARKLQCSSRT